MHMTFSSLRILRSVNAQRWSSTITPASYIHGTSQVPLINETIGRILRQSVEVSPEKELFIFSQDRVRRTFAQFLFDTEKLALGLINLGLEKGDRVGMWGPNTYEWVVSQFATALAGFIMVSINPAYKSFEAKFVLHKSGVKALISATSFKKANYYNYLVELVPEIVLGQSGIGTVENSTLPEFRHLILLGSESYRGAWKFDDILESGANSKTRLDLLENCVQADDPVNIQFTSGTTGQPKGATLTHHNIVNNALFFGIRGRFSTQACTLCVPNPLYHCFGCVLGSLSAVLHRAKCVFPSPIFDTFSTLQAIHMEKCTTVYGTPTMFIDLLNDANFDQFDMSSVNSGIMAGAPCPIELCKKLLSKMHMEGIQIAYGSTETSPVSFMSILEDPPKTRVLSVGHILDHVEAKVVDSNGYVLPRGEKGELLIRGHLVMNGYWDDEKMTKKDITSDRWYHTGDVVRMNKNGSMVVVGRIRDTIIRGGENIYPTEIEQFLFEHPQIEDVHVIGIPDERLGEAVCAWIRLYENTSGVTAESIKNFCMDKIAHFKIPQYICFKKEHEFPMTISGKVKKFEIRKLAKKEFGLENVKSHFYE